MPSMDPGNMMTMNWYLILARRVLILNLAESLAKLVQALQPQVLRVLLQAAYQPLKNSLQRKILGRRRAVTNLPIELIISCILCSLWSIVLDLTLGIEIFCTYHVVYMDYHASCMIVVVFIVASPLGYQDNAHLLASCRNRRA